MGQLVFALVVQRVNMRYLILTILFLLPQRTSSADVILRNITMPGGNLTILTNGGNYPPGSLQDTSGNFLMDGSGHFIQGS